MNVVIFLKMSVCASALEFTSENLELRFQDFCHADLILVIWIKKIISSVPQAYHPLFVLCTLHLQWPCRLIQSLFPLKVKFRTLETNKKRN